MPTTEYNMKYYVANKDKHMEFMSKYRKEHKEDIATYNRSYYANHQDELKAYKCKYRQENKEKCDEYRVKYQQANKDKLNQYEKNRRIKLGRFTCECGVEMGNEKWIIEKHNKSPKHIATISIKSNTLITQTSS